VKRAATIEIKVAGRTKSLYRHQAHYRQPDPGRGRDRTHAAAPSVGFRTRVVPCALMRDSRIRAAAVFVLLGLIAYAATLAIFAPGYMTRDSGVQLDQARSFELNDAHPVLMALVWRFIDRIVPGPLGMLLLMAGLYWAALSALFWSLEGGLPARALGLLAVGFFPPIFSVVPVIWKDTLMQVGLLAGITCLVLPTARGRWLRVALALVFFVVAVGARHNAVAAVWPFLVIAVLSWPALRVGSPGVRLLLASGISILGTLGLGLGSRAAAAGVSRNDHVWQYAAAFDLAGMSLRTGQVLLPPEAGVLTVGMGLGEIRQLYRPDYAMRLYNHCVPYNESCVPVLHPIRQPQQLDHLSAAWRRALVAHPGAYLRHRLAVVAWLVGIIKARPKNYFLEESPMHYLVSVYPPPPRAMGALAAIERALGWVVFNPLVYVGACLVLLALAGFRYLRRSGPLLPVLFGLSGLSYLVSLVVAAASPDYRYMVWTIACAVLGGVTSLWPPGRDRAERGDPASG
jgi:hypothetical protein